MQRSNPLHKAAVFSEASLKFTDISACVMDFAVTRFNRQFIYVTSLR